MVGKVVCLDSASIIPLPVERYFLWITQFYLIQCWRQWLPCNKKRPIIWVNHILNASMRLIITNCYVRTRNELRTKIIKIHDTVFSIRVNRKFLSIIYSQFVQLLIEIICMSCSCYPGYFHESVVEHIITSTKWTRCYASVSN